MKRCHVCGREVGRLGCPNQGHSPYMLDAIDKWHESNDPRSLHEYLGMTWEQYKRIIEGVPAANHWLAELRHNLRTQDNRGTAHPMFIVQQRERIYGVDGDYTENFVYLDDEGNEWTGSLLGRPGSVAKLVGYIDRWQFVTACFTEDGAKAYIAANGHNLRDPRIYVESAYRNEEWQRVTKLLMGDDA